MLIQWEEPTVLRCLVFNRPLSKSTYPTRVRRVIVNYSLIRLCLNKSNHRGSWSLRMKHLFPVSLDVYQLNKENS